MYPAKVLLFGEYVALLGARALALPFAHFSGRWCWSNGADQHPSLLAFAHSEVLASIEEIEVDAFRKDISKGLSFCSDIPIGYGLGSSGALCAAAYDRYARSKAADLNQLRERFARMESYFHGQSSGLDPLTSYLRCPLLVTERYHIHRFEQHPWENPPPSVYLLNTGQPRQTRPLVEWFLERYRQPHFAALLREELLPAHEALISAWQNGQGYAVWPLLKTVSSFQLEYFQPMIPDRWRPLWREGIASGECLFKLCGAGGGGFLLVFGRNARQVEERLAGYVLLRFI